MTGPGGDPPESGPRVEVSVNGAALTRVKPVAVVLRAYTTEHAIGGTELVSALVAVGWEFNTDLEVFVFVLGSVGIYWLSHIYSMIVAREESRVSHGHALWSAIWTVASESIGMVLAMLLPAAFLLLAVFGVLDEYVAYYITLRVGVGILAVLGFVNARRRGKRWPMRLSNAALTSGMGLFIIWLGSLVH